MRTAAVLAIDGYRRFISPYKGFSCAHKWVHHNGSCSEFGRRAFCEHEFLDALRLLRGRFRECKTAAATLRATAAAATAAATTGSDSAGPGSSEPGPAVPAAGAGQGDERPKQRSKYTWVDACNVTSCLPTGDCGLAAGALDTCSIGNACACSF